MNTIHELCVLLSVLVPACLAPAQSPVPTPSSGSLDAECPCVGPGLRRQVPGVPNWFPIGFPLETWGPLATPGQTTGRGRPIVLRWGLAANQAPIPAAPVYGVPAPATSDLRLRVMSFYPGGLAAFTTAVTTALNQWSAKCGVTFVHEPLDDGATMDDVVNIVPGPAGVIGVRADIRIGGCNFTGSNPSAGYSSFPGGGGDIVLNTFSMAGTGAGLANGTFLSNLIRHEVGHSLGLGHVCPRTNSKIMEAILSTTVAMPIGLDDQIGGHLLFGDVFEPADDSPATAPQITLAAGGPSFNEQGHSIDVNSTLADVDTFALVATTAGIARITVTPTGAAYSVFPDFNGASVPCGAVTTVTPSLFGDLQISASTHTANRTSNGSGEMLEVVFSAPGTATVTVSTVGNANLDFPQMYNVAFFMVPLPAYPANMTAQTGSVLDASNQPEATLAINGSSGGTAHRVDVPVGQTLALSMARPSIHPGGSAGFAVWAIAGAPPGPEILWGAGVGSTCFNPLVAPAFLVADTYGIFGSPLLLASPANPVYTSPPAPPFTAPAVFTLQGIVDISPGVLRATNAVMVNVHW